RTIRRILGRQITDRVRRRRVEQRDCADILRMAARVNPDLIWMGFAAISFPLVRLLKASTSHKLVVQTDGVHSRALLTGVPFASQEDLRRRVVAAGTAKLEEETWGTALGDAITAVSEI